jgi:hypothetical protein
MTNWGRDLRLHETSTDRRTKTRASSVVVAGEAGLEVTEDAAIFVVVAAAAVIGAQEVGDTTGEAAEVEDSEIIGEERRGMLSELVPRPLTAIPCHNYLLFSLTLLNVYIICLFFGAALSSILVIRLGR